LFAALAVLIDRSLAAIEWCGREARRSFAAFYFY
jgi:hypothetical protein